LEWFDSQPLCEIAVSLPPSPATVQHGIIVPPTPALSIFLNGRAPGKAMRPTGSLPAPGIGSDDYLLRSSRKRGLRLISAGERPTNSSQFSKSRTRTVCSTSGCFTMTLILVRPCPILPAQWTSRNALDATCLAPSREAARSIHVRLARVVVVNLGGEEFETAFGGLGRRGEERRRPKFRRRGGMIWVLIGT
jgi:hypothetical protein